MAEILAYAFALGLAFNATPGAVFAESLRRGARGGFGPAFAVQVGSLVGDAAWVVLGLAGAGALFQLPAARLPVAVFGCGVLLWLGWQALRDATRSAPPESAEAASASRAGPFAAGAALSLGNPWNVVYWSGAAGSAAAVVGEAPSASQLALFFGGFMLASLIWCFACAGAIAGLRRILTAPVLRALDAACGLLLAGFGVTLLYRALAPLW